MSYFDGNDFIELDDDSYRYETDSNAINKIYREYKIIDVVVSDDVIWIAASNGLYDMKKDELIPKRLSERKYSVLFDASSYLVAEEGTSIVSSFDNISSLWFKRKKF